MMKTMVEMDQRLRVLEERLSDLSYDSKRLIETQIKRSFKVEAQPQTLNAPIVGYCVSTIDPLKLNRVRVFHPLLAPPDAKISTLPFARNCTNTGGIDDCGGSWVPPAGSSVVIICENGDRQSPIVIGTVWHKDRGPQGSYFPYPIDEFYKLWRTENYRGLGYLLGKTDGSQVYPPWDTESSNGINYDNESDIDKDIDAQKKITYPNIYGWKTPGKHMIKMVDGDYRCNNRWARLEIKSKTGIWFMMKDDFFHPAGEWANPNCCGKQGTVDNGECDSVSALTSLDAFGLEDNQGDFTGVEVGGGGSVGGTLTRQCKDGNSLSPRCSNPYFKRIDECTPYQGTPTPQNAKCALPQSGAQLQTLSGHQLVMDDSVNQPREAKINWLRTFNYGCDNKLKAKMFLKSGTGHKVILSDSETTPEIRDKNNGITLETATGHYLKMIDETGPDCKAGDHRAITMGSTSGHTLTMSDKGNEQCSPKRAEGGTPATKAKGAFVQLRSGYGLLFRMDDSTSQEETRNQYILLAASPKKVDPLSCTNEPHTLLMELEEGGGGFVELSSGGKFILLSRQDSLEAVGTEDCSANKLTEVFGSYLIDAKEFLFTKSQIHLDMADRYIILGAGQDCPITNNNANKVANDAANAASTAVQNALNTGQSQPPMGPCIYPIIIAKAPVVCRLTGIIHWTKYSDRVFASSAR